MNVLETLDERGFIEKTTHEKELSDYLSKGSATCYTGFDPTASSLHVGSLIPIMALAHMQKNGHRPISLIGGGTALIGDPSGKTEMRKMLTSKEIDENAAGIKKQLSHFVSLNDGQALLLNNAKWLKNEKYIEFLRDIGRCFSVNRMISAESYKIRINSEEGLNFIEFNYMILQAYDFLKLFETKDCRLQMGGSDQWGNIVAGIDLIRRKCGETAFGITFPLITTSGGEKMGKTAKGAVWLDPKRTIPYDYYQYWRNTDDRDVARFLALFTFLPMEEIREIDNLSGADLNIVKSVLAFESTQLAHGTKEAMGAYEAAVNKFGGIQIPVGILPSSTIPRQPQSRMSSSADDSAVSDVGIKNESMPHTYMNKTEFKDGVPAFKIFHMTGLAKSGGAARRLIDQGGAYINGKRVESVDYMVIPDDINNMEILLRAGKKRYNKIIIKK
jgi:tyrosyl-tRNA synthetase